MDVLSEVLNTVGFADAEFSSAILTDAMAGSPQAGRPQNAIDVHAVRAGALLVRTPGAALRLYPGDAVMLVRAGACELTAVPGGGICHLVNVRLLADRPLFQPLLDALPELLPLRHEVQDGDRIARLVELAVEESAGRREGRETILSRTGELIFADMVRSYFEASTAEGPDWLSGLRDPHLGEALRMLHQRPIDLWTVESLARKVGLSRSVFADRFQQHFGMGVMHYLFHWRMEMAAKLLRRSALSLAEAGAQIGYHSEAAFSRAFKRHMGVSPGVWRGGRLPPESRRGENGDDHGIAS